MRQIITSLLDTDLYKITVKQVIDEFLGNEPATYSFINRGGTEFPSGFADTLRKQVEGMAGVRLTDAELEWINIACPYLGIDFLVTLQDFRFKPEQVAITQDGGKLDIQITGPWSDVVLWEVPLMATISELYFEMTNQFPDDTWDQRAMQKASILRKNNIAYVDFGTRRRFSKNVHASVLALLAFGPRGTGLVGTSNVDLARRYRLKPIGTYGHEWPMGVSFLYGAEDANEAAMEMWTAVYRGLLGIALTDTYTTDIFLRRFGSYDARLWDGVRQDSGDPIAFMEKMVAHYTKLGIDPKSKTIVFSDSLDVDRVLEIESATSGRVKTVYGIGTNLMNDVGVKPLNIVIKLTSVGGKPVVKLSDDPGKHTGDPVVVQQVKQDLGLD